MKHSRLIKASLLITAGISFYSCASTKIEVTPETTSREIIQFAQDSYDMGNKKKALEYYNILLQRYGMDNAIYIEGKYEIAHIYVKEKKYDEAKPILEEIISLYDNTAPGLLPGAFKKMAQNDLKKISEK